MGDYHRARWSALQQDLPHVNVYAADLGSSDTLYGWENTFENAKYFRLSAKRPEQIDLWRIMRFVAILRKNRIGTVCIAGYGKLEYLFFLLYGRISGRKVVMFAESWYPGNPIVDFMKSIFLKVSCHGFLVSGTRAFQHFERRLKIQPSRIRVGYSVVDNEHFRSKREVTRKDRVLCVARFSPEKNLHILIEAFAQSKLYGKWDLLIVGGGPLKQSLEGLCAGYRQIELKEWQAYDELPFLYSNAGFFVLPSIFEPWGLVVNEAMSAGLPLLLSDKVGCVPDLLLNGENGWSFEPIKDKITSAFDTVADCPDQELRRMGESSASLISNFTLKTFSRNLCELIR